MEKLCRSVGDPDFTRKPRATRIGLRHNWRYIVHVCYKHSDLVCTMNIWYGHWARNFLTLKFGVGFRLMTRLLCRTQFLLDIAAQY